MTNPKHAELPSERWAVLLAVAAGIVAWIAVLVLAVPIMLGMLVEKGWKKMTTMKLAVLAMLLLATGCARISVSRTGALT